MGLNPGRVVDLRFQRAMDPQSMKELLDKNPRDIWDEHMSGRYLITSAIHQFKEGKYYTNIKVKRDSFAINIDNINE
jgi:predicted transcriptional regulator